MPSPSWRATAWRRSSAISIPRSARVLLVQAAPRILPTFPEALSAKAQRALEQLGVEVLLNSRVEHIDERGVTVSGTRIAVAHGAVGGGRGGVAGGEVAGARKPTMRDG